MGCTSGEPWWRGRRGGEARHWQHGGIGVACACMCRGGGAGAARPAGRRPPSIAKRPARPLLATRSPNPEYGARVPHARHCRGRRGSRSMTRTTRAWHAGTPSGSGCRATSPRDRGEGAAARRRPGARDEACAAAVEAETVGHGHGKFPHGGGGSSLYLHPAEPAGSECHKHHTSHSRIKAARRQAHQNQNEGTS